MTVLTHSWEHSLLPLALYDQRHMEQSHRQTTQGVAVADPKLLNDAYAVCEKLTEQHSRSFYLSSRLLPADKRRAVRALYAFCRVTDDVVDRAAGDAALDLAMWRERLLSSTPDSGDPVILAWTDARLRYHVPQQYVEQLLNGVAQDLSPNRYQTFDELAAYSYGVASTVGLMSMYITGFTSWAAIPYAVKLGVALQVTNILRDVAEDFANGRVYLPIDELHSFGLDESDLAAGRVNDNWRAFMRFQIARNRQLYAEAWPGIGLLNPDGRFAIGAAADLYQAILDDIESHDYDVFSRRAYVNSWGKLRRLPSIWMRTRSSVTPLPSVPFSA